MDMYDVRSIEFLDFDGVDEKEQIRLRTSLLQNDPSVQLPWVETESKLSSEEKSSSEGPILQQTDLSAATSASYVDYNHHLMMNNVYVNRDHFTQPAVAIPHMIPANVVYYSSAISPMSPSYPQAVFIPGPAEVPILQAAPLHHYPQTSTYAEPHPNYQHVSVNNDVQNGLSPELSVNDSVIENSQSPNLQDDTEPELVAFNEAESAKMTHNTVNHQPQKAELSAVAENDIKTPPVAPPPAPAANKSWASLFSSKANGLTPGAVQNEAVKAPSETNRNEVSNNVPLCPIKNPKRAQFIDPDCYRMGEFLISHQVEGKAVSLQPRGLLNQSNYCYVNSILQALIACPPLYNLLCGLAKNVSSNEKRKPTPVIDCMCRFVKEFNQLPANLRVNNRRVENNKTAKKDQGVLINTDIPLEPSWIYRMLNGIKTDLMEGRQEDAEEFLGCLLNGLNDEMLELIKLVRNDGEEVPEKSDNTDADNWQVMGPKNKGSFTRRTDFGRTPISDIFGGYLKSRVLRAGDHITENIQPFFTLQLNIEKVNTVREALECLVMKNQLEGLTSSKTNEEVEAWQQVILDGLPVILILHLKCFDYKMQGCTKIVKALEFPIDLKIDSKLLSSKNFAPKEKQYKLFAIVYHDGKEASKGHYITDAFHVGYSSWLRYDDASVKPVLEENVLKPQGTRVPYLLFYRRCDTIRSK